MNIKKASQRRGEEQGEGWMGGVGELYLHVGPARLLPLLKLFPQQQQTEKERAGVARATDIRGIKEPMVVRRNTLKHGGISQDMLEERKTGTAKWRRCICGVEASRIGRLEKKVFLEGPFPVRYINRPRDGDFSEIEASAMD